MPLVKVDINTLASTTCGGVLALFLARAAVMLVIAHVHALVVAASGVVIAVAQ